MPAMLGRSHTCRTVGGLARILLLISVARTGAQSSPLSGMAEDGSPTITNLAQLTHALSSAERLRCSVRLEGVVCAASRPELGIVVVRDGTGVEMLELGHRAGEIPAGERIRIEGNRSLLRRTDLGTFISATPVVDNDGLHPFRQAVGTMALKAGQVPIELDWFNCLANFGLDVFWQPLDAQQERIPPSALWHANPDSSPLLTNLAPGLRVECYEGFWVKVPDFDLLPCVKSGTTTNFNLGLRTRDDMVGLRFTGLLNVPSNGTYTFSVRSDDGALLFLGGQNVSVTSLGAGQPPVPEKGWISQPMDRLDERRWLSAEGRVIFISRVGQGLELQLRVGVDTLSVRVADTFGLDVAQVLNSYVRVVGVGRPALTLAQRIILNRMVVASARDLQFVEFQPEAAQASLPLAPISHVQAVSIQEAKRELPVRVRGMITAANQRENWVSLQDDTRGIFVRCPTNSALERTVSEVWEVVGRTAPGNFAPIIVADDMKRLGEGCMPEPTRPNWNELANGSMDVQWVEFRGFVSGVQSNRLTLLLPEGSLEVQMENYFESDLTQFLRAIVRIRGTLFAIWNSDTREVEFGSVLMRNVNVSVDVPPPADPFDAPPKTVRELLLFDIQASVLHPVKIQAQALYAHGQEIFATEQGAGVRILTANPIQLHSGDLFEAVGCPEISGPSPLLRQALVRKTGTEPFPKPKVLVGSDLTQKGLDATLVSLEGKLIGIHSEQRSPVLEMQSSGQLFVARIKAGAPVQLSLRVGSRLQLVGIYVRTASNQLWGRQVESFEILLNSPFDIRVLSQPSWWTLQRLLAVITGLLVVLALAALWIALLRRRVEHRTNQLQREIRERERVEREHALEAQRSRIARDLHDDLGSSLTEIGVLASKGGRLKSLDTVVPVFRAIATKARGLVTTLDLIVWTINPEDNSLQNAADYLSNFTDEYLSQSEIVCRFDVPVTLPPALLDGRLRHDLLLAVKETLNNIVRHAQATEVEFRLAFADDQLEIVISDNGKGFDVGSPHRGNGLKNLPLRLARLGGHYEVRSVVGKGTRVTIRLRLPAAPEMRLAESSRVI